MSPSLRLLAIAAGSVGVVVAADLLARHGRRWQLRRDVRGRFDRWAAVDRRVPPMIATALDRAGIDDHRRRLDQWMAAAAVALVSAALVPGGSIIAAVVLIGPPLGVMARRGHRAATMVGALPTALDAMGSALRGGLSLTSAFGDVSRSGGPLAREFDQIHDHATKGRSLTVVIEEWTSADDATGERRLAGAAMALSATVGGAGSLALDAAAASLRERRDADAEINALSVQARLSAWLLTLTPIGFAFLLTTLDPASARFLFTTPIGWACIAAGLGLDVVGALWMRRIVGSAR